MLEFSDITVCPQCGHPLPPDAPRGLCVKCFYVAMVEGKPLEAESQPLADQGALPREFGAYELLEELARGGMGIVYRARQTQLNRIVALKVIRDSEFAAPRSRQRFQIEAEAAAKLDHPNIVPIYEFGTVGGHQFLTMKLVEGASLASRLHGVPMETQPLARLMATLAHAIHFAHQRGIIHRDLKPANILLDSLDQPQVTDFGLAKRVDIDSGFTLTADVIGSPNYMAPEQAAGRASQATMAADVYGLGAILYELLTGQPPFRAETALETMRKVVEDDPIAPRLLNKFVDQDLETICLKCMEKDPARRYSSAEALAEDLERWLRSEPILGRPLSPPERVMKWIRRNPSIAALTGLLILALATGLGGVILMNVRLSSANHQKEAANVRLASKLHDFEWQKVEDLSAAGKRSDALVLLSDFLRGNADDQYAASRVFSMLNSGNFLLPRAAPLQHGATVNSVSVSGDGQRLITGADDGKARVWELQSGRLLATLPHPLKVDSAVFAAGDRAVLTACQDGSFRLWNSDESTLLFEFPKAPNSRVKPALSRDRKRVALPETEHSLRVWELATLQPLGTSLQLTGRLMQITFSADPNVVAAAASDGSVGVWTVEDSRPITTGVKLSNQLKHIEFSPDGGMLATSSGLTLTLWDTQTWLKLKEFKAHEHEILMIGFTPDGRRLMSAPWDEPPKIWDVASGKTLGQPIGADQPHCFFQISPDGRSLATRSQSGVVRMWDALSGLAMSEPFEHEGPVTDLAFTPDGRSLVTASQDGTVRVLEIQHSRPASSILKTRDAYSTACFTRDGRQVIGTTGATALMFDLATGGQAGKPIVHANPIYRMKASPDGRKLATATWNGSARVWDLRTGDAQTPLLLHTMRLFALAFSPDSSLLATGSEDATARLWNAETGEPRSPLLRHDAEVVYVTFRGDSSMLLTAGVDSTARLWSTADGRPLWPEPIHHKGIVWSAEFDPAGRRIVTASADKSARVWDVQSRRPLTPAIRHSGGVNGARFSPDGRWVLTWSEDGTARVWNSENGEPILRPMRHLDMVNMAVFSPDGKRVLTGSRDGVVRLWDAQTGYPLCEPLRNGGAINVIEFSPDGRRFLAVADQDALKIWDIVTPPVPVPLWFCDLIQSVAGKRLSANRDAEPVGSDSLHALRGRFAAVQDSDFYSRWAKWFLWERMKDPAPEFVP